VGEKRGYVISSPQKWHYPQLQGIIFPRLVLSKFGTAGWVAQRGQGVRRHLCGVLNMCGLIFSPFCGL